MKISNYIGQTFEKVWKFVELKDNHCILENIETKEILTLNYSQMTNIITEYDTIVRIKKLRERRK